MVACKQQSGPITMDSPVPAAEAVKTFQLEEGFKIELIAAEPLVADPVAMEIDASRVNFKREKGVYQASFDILGVATRPDGGTGARLR